MPSGTFHLSKLISLLQPEGDCTVGQLGELRLGSHFQPIYSLSHARVVGHEALLRARTAGNQPVPPPQVFAACQDLRELARCDSLSRLVHLANFSAVMPPAQWIFLNVHPAVFQTLPRAEEGGESYIRSVIRHFGVPAERMVLEVLETDVPDLPELEAAMAIVRDLGCLIAIDDFGAGHSNFDRVWRLQPDIVKLDRSLITRAASDRRARRVVSQMVSLLHECGAMVLMEGVETLDEALMTMEADADMVQGYFFGRPQPALMPSGHSPDSLTGLYGGLGQRREAQHRAHRGLVAPYRHAIGNAGVLFAAGHSITDACRGFLELPGAELCYLLDADGYQIGHNVLLERSRSAPPLLAYEPLSSSDGACWARRPYFRRAVEAIGKVQITRPYRTLHGNHMCVTASYAFLHGKGEDKQLRVLCGDLRWSELDMDDEPA